MTGATGPVLVTGASGFVGAEVVRRLVEGGWQVRSTGRRPRPPGLPSDYTPADLCDAAAVRGLVRGVNAVVHVAGLAHRGAADSEFLRHNTQVAESLARASMEHAREFVLVSSIAVYGGSEGSIKTEESVCVPESPYASSKLEAERRVAAMIKESKTRLTVLRMGTVYGEADPGNCERLMRSIDKGRFAWIGRGSNRKSLIYKSDAAEACEIALRRAGSRSEIYNVSAPPERMRDIVEAFAGALGRRVCPVHIPAGLARSASWLASTLSFNRGPAARLRQSVFAWLRDDAVSTDKAKEGLGFHARTSLVEGARRQVARYRSDLGTSLRPY